MPKGNVLKGQSRELVVRLRDYFERENQNGGPMLSVSQVRERVATALGISLNTVTNITKEVYGKNGTEYNKPITPKKKNMPFVVTNVDESDADAIRRHIYDYYLSKEYPTLRRLTVSLRECGLFRGQRTSLAKVLKRIGFLFKKVNHRKILVERTDIALARCNFLRKAKQIGDWTNVIFIDETCLNLNHALSNARTDDTATSTLKVPHKKGRSLVVCHAGSKKGFVEGALLVSEKTVEHQEAMNADAFECWFQQLVLTLKVPSVIIMNNARHHSRQLNKMPTSANKKSDIINWLRNNGENVDESMLKCELEVILKAKKEKPKYVVDEIAENHGHTVLRIPPYHCQYNATALVWAQVKEYVARNNKNSPFTCNKMIELLKDSCKQVTLKYWLSVVETTRQVMLSDWERDVTFDKIREEEPIAVNLVEQSSSDENSMSEDEE